MLEICKRQLASIIDESISHLEEVYASMQPWYQDSMSNSRELQHLRSISDGRMSSRKHRRDKSEISCCLKYLIFGFNVIFWVRSCVVMQSRMKRLCQNYSNYYFRVTYD